MFLGLDFAARSDVGLVRSNNQDSAYAGPHLLVVADGMGGAAGGDIASSIVVARLAVLDGEALGQDDSLDELKAAIAEAHREIVARAHNDPELSGLGTTVTAILRAGNTIAMAHIGDSRAYLLRDGEFDQVTTDHSFVQHLVDTGRLSAADAEHHPKRSMLLRVLGDIDADVPVDISARETKPGDRWLLCSDGLSSVVSRETIEKTMKRVADPADCADELLSLALAAGAPDNVTCLVADTVDIDKAPGRVGPPTAAEVVGAAAIKERQADIAIAKKRYAETAAAKAAALRAEKGDAPDEDRPRIVKIWDRIKPWALPGGLFVAVFAATFGAYSWTQTQYYVGVYDDDVAIYRGIPQSVGPIDLSSLVETTDINIHTLEPFERERVEAAIQKSSLEDARAVVEALEGAT
jgi:PPM family protein phosphatase